MNGLVHLNSVIYSYSRPQFRGAVVQALRTVADNCRASEAALQRGDKLESARHYTAGEPDDLSYLITVARDGKSVADDAIFVGIVDVLQLLVRRHENRQQLRGVVVEAFVAIVRECRKMRVAAATSASAVRCVAAVCHPSCPAAAENGLRCVDVVDAIVSFLGVPDDELQLASLSALALLSGSSLARELFAQADGCLAVVALLYGAAPICARAVHVLQAMTGDLNVARGVVVAGGVPPLVALMQHADNAVAVAAAGCVQNISRERSSADVLLAAGAVPAAATLLLEDDVERQAAGIGAILNMHNGDETTRKQLKRILALTVAATSL